MVKPSFESPSAGPSFPRLAEPPTGGLAGVFRAFKGFFKGSSKGSSKGSVAFRV